jgi:hypothetical protein
MPGAHFRANVQAKEADDALEDVKRKVANTIEFAEYCRTASIFTVIAWDAGSAKPSTK